MDPKFLMARVNIARGVQTVATTLWANQGRFITLTNIYASNWPRRGNTRAETTWHVTPFNLNPLYTYIPYKRTPNKNPQAKTSYNTFTNQLCNSRSTIHHPQVWAQRRKRHKNIFFAQHPKYQHQHHHNHVFVIEKENLKGRVTWSLLNEWIRVARNGISCNDQEREWKGKIMT